MPKKLEIVNLHYHREYVSQVAGWIFNEFIYNHINDCKYSDIVEALEDRKKDRK